MTEVLALCLVCLLLWAWSEILRRERLSWAGLPSAGIAFAWLCLTRAIFGYVLFACLAIYLVCAALTRDALRAAHAPGAPDRGRPLPSVAAYTYARTGKLFYWATVRRDVVLLDDQRRRRANGATGRDSTKCRDTPELAPHREFFEQLSRMNEVQRDEALKARARENLAAHPSAYLRNIAANLSRMFFSFPYTHTPQKLSTLFYALPNSFLLAFATLALVRLVRRARAGLAALYPYLLFAGAAFAGTALLSAYARMLFPFVPVLLLLIVRGAQSGNPEALPEP